MSTRGLELGEAGLAVLTADATDGLGQGVDMPRRDKIPQSGQDHLLHAHIGGGNHRQAMAMASLTTSGPESRAPSGAVLNGATRARYSAPRSAYQLAAGHR